MRERDRGSVIEKFLQVVARDPNFSIGPAPAPISAVVRRWSRYVTRREIIKSVAPRMYAWLDESHDRWIRSGLRPHLGLCAPGRFPRDVAEAWGLERPPSPGACLRAFLAPDPRYPAVQTSGIDPIAWASFRLYCCGYGAYDQARDLGLVRDTRQVRAWLIEVVKSLMARPDFACWALNPHPSTMPEPLGEGWYSRNRDWIYGQLAIRQPYVQNDPRVINHSHKAKTWPEPAALLGTPVWTPPPYKPPPRRRRRRAWDVKRPLWAEAGVSLDTPEAALQRRKQRGSRRRAKSSKGRATARSTQTKCKS